MAGWSGYLPITLMAIFKVKWELRVLENGLSAPYLLNEWMDFYQTCTSILLRHGKDLIRFWWPWAHFQGHRRSQIVGKWLVCSLSPEWMNGFWPNLHSFTVVTGTRTDILMTLTSFWRSQEGLDFGKLPHRPHTCRKREIIDTIYVNNMSVQIDGGHTVFSENTVLVSSTELCSRWAIVITFHLSSVR